MLFPARRRPAADRDPARRGDRAAGQRRLYFTRAERELRRCHLRAPRSRRSVSGSPVLASATGSGGASTDLLSERIGARRPKRGERVLGAARRLVRGRPRRGRRHHRPQRRRQEHAAEDARRGSRRRPRAGSSSAAAWAPCSRSAPASTPSSPAARTSSSTARSSACAARRSQRPLRRDRRVRGRRAVPRHAGQALLERHVRAPRRSRSPRTSTPRSCSSTRCSPSATPSSSASASARWTTSRAAGARSSSSPTSSPPIQRLCRRCYWIDAGQVRAEGPTQETVAAYLKAAGAHQHGGEAVIGPDVPRMTTGDATLRRVAILDDDGTSSTRSPWASRSRSR